MTLNIYEMNKTIMNRPKSQESEEVRLQLGHFVAALLLRCSPTQIYAYIDEATGLIRAQAMDPFHEVKALACHLVQLVAWLVGWWMDEACYNGSNGYRLANGYILSCVDMV